MLVLLAIPLVSGRVCQTTLTTGQECTFMTPPLDCIATNYSIYNQTNFILNGSMSLVGNGIYSFPFNQSEGDYVITLCDNSSREIYVEDDDDMLATIIGLIAICCMFGYLGYAAGKKTQGLMSLAVRLFGYGISLITTLLIAFILFVKESTSALVPLMQIYFYIMLILSFGIGFIALIMFTIRLMNPGDNDDDKKWQR